MPKTRFTELVKTVEILRGPGGCPWDREQNLNDVKNYVLEEVYELCEAVDSKDYNSVKEELGDLFLLLVFFSSLYKDKKLFNVEDVLEGVLKKMIARHPHVFSSKKVKSARTVLNRWIRSKSKKKNRKNIYQRIPRRSPALFSSHIFLREYKNLSKVTLRDIQAKFFHSFSLFRRTKNRRYLVDIIFYAACILSFRNDNPELLLRKKVKSRASEVSY